VSPNKIVCFQSVLLNRSRTAGIQKGACEPCIYNSTTSFFCPGKRLLPTRKTKTRKIVKRAKKQTSSSTRASKRSRTRLPKENSLVSKPQVISAPSPRVQEPNSVAAKIEYHAIATATGETNAQTRSEISEVPVSAQSPIPRTNTLLMLRNVWFLRTLILSAGMVLTGLLLAYSMIFIETFYAEGSTTSYFPWSWHVFLTDANSVQNLLYGSLAISTIAYAGIAAVLFLWVLPNFRPMLRQIWSAPISVRP
jgi:hypothetical protein